MIQIYERYTGTKALAILFAALLALLTLTAGLAPLAKAQQQAPEPKLNAGPVDPSKNYPFWYEDRDGTRLELCLEASPLCGEGGPTGPINSFADFPAEGFYWGGDAVLDVGNGGRAVLAMSLQSAFLNPVPKDGEQITISGIVINARGLVSGQEYTFRTPYGDYTETADDRGQIRIVDEALCGAAPCDFSRAAFGKIGPFLKWDPNVGPAAPEGYVGDPLVNHAVVGSPVKDAAGNPQNYFEVEGPNAAGGGAGVVQSVKTGEFSVVGKLAKLRVGAGPRGGFYNTPQSVSLAASDPAQIYYTTDPNVPDADIVSPNNAYTSGQKIAIGAMNDVTTLRSVAVIPATATQQEVRSDVFTEKYTLDDTAPNVVADPAGGTFNDVAPPVSLNVTNNEPGPVETYYTTDGSDPSVIRNKARVLFDPAKPINIRKTTTLKFVATDAAGNQSDADPATPGAQSYTENYTIIDATPPLAPTALDLATATDTGESGTDNITNATALTFTGNAEPGSTVRILVAGVEKGSAIAAEGTGAFSVTTSALDPGTDIPVTATATDPTGNEGVASTLTITIDTTNPTVSASPAGGTYPRAQSVTLTPSEAAKVYYTRNGGTPNPGAAGTTQATGVINIAANTTLRSIAVDTAGNRSGVSTQTYRIQNARPTVTAFGPTGRIADRTPNIAATVNDTDSNLVKNNITLTVDGRNIPRANFTYNATSNRLTYTSRQLSIGRHTVTIRATDVDGGTITRSFNFTIR